MEMTDRIFIFAVILVGSFDIIGDMWLIIDGAKRLLH